MERKAVKPYDDDTSKKDQVARMFDNISHKYDFLNHFFSMGIDILWRKKMVRMLKGHAPTTILDIATGTGDLAIECLRLEPEHVTGIDISEGMLEKGREKLSKKGLEKRITLEQGDSENLPYEDDTFDAVVVAFGIRNFEDLDQGLSEMYRVLAPGGKALMLEFSQPKGFPIRGLYKFYFNNIMPLLGKTISKDDAAYSYLPGSVQAFPEGKELLSILERNGFRNTSAHSQTFGIATIYEGMK